ncbi:MAG: fumarylacetoacetate hydrolase family protein [Hyphomonadaceae bacterium]
MKFLSYRAGGVARFGLAGADGAIDLTARTGAGSLKALIALGGLKNAARWADAPADHAWAAVEFLPVIPDPGKIFCIGVNYEEHRTETGRPKVSAPTVFTRFADTQIGHGAAIPKPAHSDHVDFEGELAVIIGEGGRDIPEARALDHVAGFSCYNDVSIRDFQ